MEWKVGFEQHILEKLTKDENNFNLHALNKIK